MGVAELAELAGAAGCWTAVGPELAAVYVATDELAGDDGDLAEQNAFGVSLSGDF